MSNSYTFQILDPNDLVSTATEASITIDAQFVIGLISRYISWKGTMDFVVEIRSGSDLTWSDADGLLPSFVQLGWTGSAWTNQTLSEALTGFDPDPNRPDAGLTIYLAADGTIKNYGAPVWFDPNPGFEVNPAVPAGSQDFVSILTHEIFHSLGFINYTQEWSARIVTAGDVSYFTGARSEGLYGGAIPIRSGYDHYGYAQDPSIPISRGLMYEFGNYEQNRWEIGRIDLAMLADMGYSIKTYDGLSLFELLDSATNLTGTEAGETLYGDYHSNILSGLGGNDRIEAGSGNDQLGGGDGNDLLLGGAGVDTFDGGGNLTTYDPVTVYGDRISFAEATATQGVVADLRTGIISDDGFGNAETMTGIESLGGGTAFADTLDGDAGRNALLGSRGDTLNGHDGDDFVQITAAPALANGGSGTDLLELSSNGGFFLPDADGDGLAETAAPMPGAWLVDLASGSISDGYGNIGAVAGFENVSGSAAGDELRGDDNANILEGGDGDDTLNGAGGDDRLAGGQGKDAYSGGAGTDTIDFSGEAGPVVVNLFPGVFLFPAGHPFGFRSVGPGEALDSFGNYETLSGIENLILTGGNDRVLADDGANRIEAGSGNDNIIGAGGNDVIYGGDGNDTIDGGDGDDSMIGGIGNDIYVVGSAEDSVVENPGEGTDEIRTPLASYSLFGTNVENLIAWSNVAHDFRGNGSNNVIAGAGGSDVIRLQDGGDDIAVGGGGDDQFFYGAAFTALDANSGGSGTDVVILQGDYAVTMAAGSLTGVEYLSLQSGSSTRYQNLPVTDHDYNITFVDANVEAGQRFTVNASQLLAAESFTFNGAAESNGSFLIYGGYGADLVIGGSGNDIFHFEGSRWGSNDQVDGGAGADSVVIRGTSGLYHIEFGETQLTGIESISVSDRFGMGQSSLPSYEFVLANGNVTAGGTLILNGSTLLDPGQTLSVDGSAVSGGNLKIYGGAGGDTLIGGGGDDFFYAAGGADRMTGGEGRDIFQLRSLSDSPLSDVDSILDFVSGADKIDLRFIDADSTAAGDQAFTFVGEAFSGNGTAGSGVAGELRSYQDGASGTWYVEGDVDGDGHADFQIAVVPGTPGLVSTDFFL
ncbi:MAG: calcium-binding protein [Allosphingosinicella sp.]